MADRPKATHAAGDAVRDLGAFIRQQRTEARLSLRRLAEMAEVSNPYLSQIERGLRKPSAEILQRVAEALRISAETLYVQAGILDQPSDDLADRIMADPHLTEDQKRALVQVYRSFRTDGRDPVDAASAMVEQPQEPAPATDPPITDPSTTDPRTTD